MFILQSSGQEGKRKEQEVSIKYAKNGKNKEWNFRCIQW